MQREQSITIITSTWSERDAQIVYANRSATLRSSPVCIKGRATQYNVLLPPNNSLQRMVDFSVPAIQRARRVSLANALRQSWLVRIASISSVIPSLPSSYRPFEWRDIQLCQMCAPATAMDPAAVLAAVAAAEQKQQQQTYRDCAMEARPSPSIDGVGNGNDGGVARLHADFKLVAAAFTHFTFIVWLSFPIATLYYSNNYNVCGQ